MHFIVIPLLWLTVHRLTRLVTRDQIFERPDHERRIGFIYGPRTWFIDRIEDKGAVGWKIAYLVSCDWCTSMWMSGVVTTLIALYTTRVMHESWWPWPVWVLIALAGSSVTGLIAQHEPD